MRERLTLTTRLYFDYIKYLLSTCFLYDVTDVKPKLDKRIFYFSHQKSYIVGVFAISFWYHLEINSKHVKDEGETDWTS